MRCHTLNSNALFSYNCGMLSYTQKVYPFMELVKLVFVIAGRNTSIGMRAYLLTPSTYTPLDLKLHSVMDINITGAWAARLEYTKGFSRNATILVEGTLFI